ncbi:MAG: hypothetical protein RLO12_06770 [Fulvivirga sp.]
MRIKSLYALLFIGLLISSCQNESKPQVEVQEVSPITGTWKLLKGTIIQGNDTTITDYTINADFIKIITDTHFAFMRHDLGMDSVAVYVSGGGRCEVKDNKYIEHLDFCNYREWEGHTFSFDFEISGDTLTTKGIEKIEDLGVEQFNIEQYIRVE